MIFVDESIQQTLGYICVGFAFCEHRPDEDVHRALADSGLRAGIDEYKSGIRMVGLDARQSLRDRIHHVVLSTCKLGLYVAPIAERPSLLSSVAVIADELVAKNGLQEPQEVFVDEGILGKATANPRLVLNTHCDSRIVPGIQLADFVAYHCSYLLKCALGAGGKTILMGDDPHPLSGEEVELDWILRTSLRRNFFVERGVVDDDGSDFQFFKLAGFGAFFSPGLSAEVRAAAEQTFDSMYFGCVW